VSGHDSVVRCNDHDCDVRDLGAAGAHGREGLVARRIEEDDVAAVLDDLAGADVLSDAAALPGRDLGCSDRIEERRLAVVDVAHDRDDRGARLKEARVVLLIELLFRGGAYRSRLTLRTVAAGAPPPACAVSATS